LPTIGSGIIFGTPWLQPKTIIKNVLGEPILELPVRDLTWSTCLRGKDLSHADLRGQYFYLSQSKKAKLFEEQVRSQQ